MTRVHREGPRLLVNPLAGGHRNIALTWAVIAIVVAILSLGPRVRQALYLNLASVAVSRGYALHGTSTVGTCPEAGPADAADALRFADALLDLDRDHAAAWRQMGHALWLTGELVQAEAAFRRAIRANPEDAPARDALAHLHVATGQVDQAVSEWRQLGYAERLVALGERLAGERRWQQAIVAYQAAIDVSPGRADAYYGIGCARYRWVGDVTGALAAFLTARSLEPGSPWPYACIGDLYASERRAEEAIPWYEQALQTAPREPGLHSRVAAAYVEHGTELLQAQLWDQAEDALRRALELDPGNVVAQRQLATLGAAPWRH